MPPIGIDVISYTVLHLARFNYCDHEIHNIWRRACKSVLNHFNPVLRLPNEIIELIFDFTYILHDPKTPPSLSPFHRFARNVDITRLGIAGTCRLWREIISEQRFSWQPFDILHYSEAGQGNARLCIHPPTPTWVLERFSQTFVHINTPTSTSPLEQDSKDTLELIISKARLLEYVVNVPPGGTFRNNILVTGSSLAFPHLKKLCVSTRVCEALLPPTMPEDFSPLVCLNLQQAPLLEELVIRHAHMDFEQLHL